MINVTVESASEACVDLCKEKKMRVLHVDDDAEFLAVAKQCLEEQGQFQVDTAMSAEKALEKLKNAEYDAVVVDYQMPGKNGLELLKRLRQEGSDIPFILLTCKGKEEIAIEALNSGVYQYIDKQGGAEATYEELKRSICNAVKRRRTERLLKESENRLRQITENMQDMLLLTDVNLIITYASASHKWILGYEPNEMTGKCIFDLVHPDDLPRVMEVAKKTLGDGSEVKMEVRIRHADGHYLLLGFTGKDLNDDNGQLIGTMLTSRDITESKKISEKAHFQARLLNAVGQAIIATDMNGTITYWNLAAEQLYGWTETEVLGRNIVDVTPAETSREQAADILNRLIAGEYWSGEFLAKRRDGTAFPAIVTDAPITNDRGEFIGIIGISTDITEQKWMQEVLGQAIAEVAGLNEKLRVVEGLTRHDIRNKLCALNGRIYLLKKRFGGNQEALQHLMDMELVSQQMSRIMEFEKIYIQVGAEELKCVDVETHLNEAASLFSDLKGAQLINECHGLTVLADSLLRQLFYNLIDNTLKYGEKTSKIRVHYEEEENQLKLIYEDDGVGIPAEMKSNIFNEGYGRGTGFGLYLLKRICEAYGWTIQETGKPGQGAQFTMTVPKNGTDDKRSYEIS
jgi:PAS domain S-box-containing protein